MKSKLLDKILTPKIILCFLIVVGVVLRICSVGGTLTHDELSAICRTNFDNFHDLIAKGVYVDGHPAGVHVFLWFWSRLFGTSAIAIRLPFLLMGIASVPLVYAVGRRWYGEWPALLPTAIMAVTQFPVYYSIIARPYIAGLFLMLCMLYLWTRILLDKEYKWYWLVLFALFAALCAYTHYFCLLSAFLLGLAGLLFVDRQHVWYYLVACLCAMLLFLPHWGITAHQLFDLQGIGGENGWLGKPKLDFLLEFFRYLFHHSWFVVVIAIFCYLLNFSLKDNHQHFKLVMVSVAIWFIQFLIGYLYSIKINPVLQFSSLIFVFPFLPMALAGGVNREEHHYRQALVILVYCVVMVMTLIVNRHHFQVVRSEWIEASARMEREAIDRYGSDQVLCMLDVALDKVQYYDPTLYSLPQSAIENHDSFDSLLSVSKENYILCGGIRDPKLLEIVMHHYPQLLQYYNGVVSEVLLFGRQPEAEAVDLNKMVLFDCHKSLSSFEGEFYDILDTVLGDITDSRFVCVSNKLLFHQPDSVKGSLRMVMEVYVGNRRVEWREANTADLHYCKGDTCELCLPVRLETCVKHRSQLHRARLKVYLWNPEGDTITVPYACRITLYPTNPFIYSALEEI